MKQLGKKENNGNKFVFIRRSRSRAYAKNACALRHHFWVLDGSHRSSRDFPRRNFLKSRNGIINVESKTGLPKIDEISWKNRNQILTGVEWENLRNQKLAADDDHWVVEWRRIQQQHLKTVFLTFFHPAFIRQCFVVDSKRWEISLGPIKIDSWYDGRISFFFNSLDRSLQKLEKFRQNS